MSPPVLPEELFVEILSWVPVKALMRFRCVSKWWNSLVFDPTFVKLHLQRTSKNTQVLLTFDNYESKYCAPCSIHGLLENPSSTIYGCHPFKHGYRLLGVCNGLVCLLDSYRGNGFVGYCVRFWNPATRVISEDSPHTQNNDGPFSIWWLRVVLDEARTIKSSKSQISAAAAALIADRCWCLTGTLSRLHNVVSTCNLFTFGLVAEIVGKGSTSQK
ncbi:SWI/SNF-related matrix-associated actin-dependent regulator of chromatin [Spatholobus suberectus]|nr:SWI/SNF-related matrix-associated actin-dependent regulator of chromatin [Spatholobus suberectus]